MSLFKYIERIKSIHYWIENERTGSSIQFAKKMGISRSLLMENLREMREEFGAPIIFNRKRNTFYYSEPFYLQISIASTLDKIKGGIYQPEFGLFVDSCLNVYTVEMEDPT